MGSSKCDDLHPERLDVGTCGKVAAGFLFFVEHCRKGIAFLPCTFISWIFLQFSFVTCVHFRYTECKEYPFGV
jgi:hypothetical protein